MTAQFPPESYGKRPLVAMRLDAQRSAAFSRGQDQVVPMATVAVELLNDCAGFRTLQEHADRIASARKLSPAAQEELRDVLAGFAQKGLLVSKSTLLERARQGNAPAPPPIEGVCVATRGRPDVLPRCIRSYAANMRAFGRAPTWTILDSSPEPAARRRTRESLRALDSEGVVLHYASLEDKARFATALSTESGVDPDIVRFALFDVEGMDYDLGANRNALLLAHAGQMVFSVDDDTVCELRVGPDSPEKGIELTAVHLPDYLLFQSVDEARASLPPVNHSILGAHEEFLGRTLGGCLGHRNGEDVVADGLSEDALETILAGTARVGTTFGGIWGDCASTSAAHYLFCQGVRPGDLPTDEPNYRRTVASRQVLRAAKRPTLSQFAAVMTASFAVDLRQLCPPFFPTRRAQDHIFGTLLRSCFDDHFFGFLPVAVGHLPTMARRADPDGLWGTARPKFNALVFCAICLTSVELARPGAPRLRLLGRQLAELGSLPWPEFERVLLRRTWQTNSSDLRLLQNQLSLAAPSSPWARDARNYLRALWEGLTDIDVLVPHELRVNRSRDEARALMQRQLRRFGELLEAWPEIFRAAQRLSERGFAFARPL